MVNVYLLEKLVGAILEGHAGTRISGSREVDGCSWVVGRVGQWRFPIDALYVRIGLSQMHRQTSASLIASGAFTAEVLCAMADVAFRGFAVSVYRVAPASLALS
eukprot:873943-Pyramimonas_sp.AAC.1